MCQTDNGAHLSGGDADITDTESEISVKEEDIDEDPLETTYVPNMEEEFGDVRSVSMGVVLSLFLILGRGTSSGVG